MVLNHCILAKHGQTQKQRSFKRARIILLSEYQHKLMFRGKETIRVCSEQETRLKTQEIKVKATKGTKTCKCVADIEIPGNSGHLLPATKPRWTHKRLPLLLLLRLDTDL